MMVVVVGKMVVVVVVMDDDKMKLRHLDLVLLKPLLLHVITFQPINS